MPIRVVHKRPGMPAEVVSIENTLDEFQRLLDGGCLTAIRLTSDIHGYVDDEGLLKELPLNFLFRGEPIVGPAVFSKLDARGEDIGFQNESEALEFAASLNGNG